MPQYLLQAGNTPALTWYEAQVMLSQCEKIDAQTIAFEAESDEVAQQHFEKLGAAVRLVRVVQGRQPFSPEEAEASLLGHLSELPGEKIRFSVAQWGDRQTTRVSLFSLKEKLEKSGKKVRFIEGPRDGLSAAILNHQNVAEFVLFQNEKRSFIGRTIAVQNIDHWTFKDRKKPYADRKKGMLPPKLARTLVNIALGPSPAAQTLVYDPFCGTGTVLIEALERGVHVAGSDSDPEAVVGAQTNLAWFADAMQLSPAFTVFHSDVSHVRPDQLPGKVDAIVTEPFLGKPTPKPAQLPGIFRGLEKLYLGAFHQWEKLLKNEAKVVMIFPRVELVGGKTYDMSGFIDKLRSRGYTLQVDFEALQYHRQGAIVQRQIGIFQYKLPDQS